MEYNSRVVIDRFQTHLGSGDRNKLSEYLEAIRYIERRIQRAEQQNAGNRLQLPVMERPSSIPETVEEHCKLMFDLQVMAYRTDMTRVITFMLAPAGSNRAYPAIGIADGHHSLTHHQNNAEKVERVAKIDASGIEGGLLPGEAAFRSRRRILPEEFVLLVRQALHFGRQLMKLPETRRANGWKAIPGNQCFGGGLSS
jgi:hypothetical protein